MKPTFSFALRLMILKVCAVVLLYRGMDALKAERLAGIPLTLTACVILVLEAYVMMECVLHMLYAELKKLGLVEIKDSIQCHSEDITR